MCVEHSTGEQLLWKQVCVMISYKGRIPEGLSRSQARIRQSSLLGEQLCEQIVQQIMNNVSLCTIGRNLSTVCNIINGLREYGEICVSKQQGRNQH